MSSPNRRILLLIILIGIAAVFITPWFLRGLGYYVDSAGWEIGEIAANKKNSKLCNNIIIFSHIFGPTTSERRADCITHYASLTLDYSACESLLPASPGFSCLGEVSAKLFTGKPCSFSSAHNNVYCNKEYSEGELIIENPQIQNCLLYTRKDLREWCYFERTSRSEKNYECHNITHPIMKDYCEYTNALTQKDVALCGPIKDKSRHDFCEFRVNTSVKYSS